MTIAFTGASGFIARRLIPRLQRQGHVVRALGRRDPRIAGVEFASWDASGEPSSSALEGAGAVIHLAGEPVAQRWSAEVKKRIYDSRVTGTRNLVAAMARLKNPPETLVAASAIGYYGDRGDEVLTEVSPPGSGFLPQTCIDWERESAAAADLGTRVTLLRIGIVLGLGGGALQTMLPPFKAGVGGPIGSGRQWVSWIHIDDVTGLIEFGLRTPTASGPLNATAPQPVRNAEFAKELGGALRRPSLLPAPAFGLKLLYGEMADVILASQRVVPEATQRAGYSFGHPELRQALRQILT
jgi:uncharacterized protein